MSSVINANLLLDQMNDLEKKIFKYLLARPEPVMQTDLLDEVGVSQSTVSRQLQKMMERGIVEKTGQTKAARFSLTPNIRYWSTPYHRRTPAPFSPQRFRDYQPNVTQWLPDHVRAQMAAAAPTQKCLDASTYSRGIAERFLIDLSWASSSLEGNTYSLLETESLVKYGQIADNKSTQDATMILNHKRAIAILLEQVGGHTISKEMVQKIHTFMMRDLLDFSALGKIRKTGVRISSSSYIPSDNHLELTSTLGEMLFKAEQIQDPYEAMFFIMAGMSYLQPFEDGNKRMGRLMCNLPLLRAGLPPMSFLGVDKTDYIQGLIEFYELNEKSLLAHTLGKAYVGAAHVYQASTQALRTPRSIELKLRKEITSMMGHVIENKIFDHQGMTDLVVHSISDISDDDLQTLVGVMMENSTHMDETNGSLWNVDDDLISQYILARDHPQPATKSKSHKI